MAVQSRNLPVSRVAALLSGLLLGLTQCGADSATSLCLEGRSAYAACLAADGGSQGVHLLQTRAETKPHQSHDQSEIAQQHRLEKAKPIVWLHVPKCGSTFLNALTQHPGICPGASEENTIENMNGPIMKGFHQHLNIHKACPSSFIHPDILLGWHDGVGSRYERHSLEGHLMTVLRNPTSRLISAYNFGKHSWPTKQRDNITLTDYVNMMQGHFLKMLTRDYSSTLPVPQKYLVFHNPVTVEEVQEAHRRLEAGFSFIGILEEWSLSMCLFHKMFGGQCVESEFRHLHQGGGSEESIKKHLMQAKELEGYEDPYDTPLYEQALARFNADLKKFDVSVDTCQECFAAAGYNPEEEE